MPKFEIDFRLQECGSDPESTSDIGTVAVQAGDVESALEVAWTTYGGPGVWLLSSGEAVIVRCK